jgi:hypothetical protein
MIPDIYKNIDTIHREITGYCGRGDFCTARGLTAIALSLAYLADTIRASSDTLVPHVPPPPDLGSMGIERLKI